MMSQIEVRHSYRMNENCVYLAYPWKKAWWHEAAKSFLIVDVILDLLISQKNYVASLKFQEILFSICLKICSAQAQNWVNYARKKLNKRLQNTASNFVQSKKKFEKSCKSDLKSDFNGADKCNRNSFCFAGMPEDKSRG